MALPDFLREELVFLDLHPKDMPECLEMIVGLAASRGAIADPVDALSRLLERERTMSTGMGGGVAIPHAKTEKCRNMVVAVGRVADGVDFKAIDGKPVHVVFLLLGPPDSTRMHVDLLARIAYLVKTPGVLDAIRDATHPSQVLEAVRVEPRERRA
ncbi:MAG TPA: PTS sugar transporter subunit IIA [Candidatus Polarisedimenticolia bacterium]|nr:PTS sugar transporter subunit IIA [Candidatus Polarisedimenticolia bacterium]